MKKYLNQIFEITIKHQNIHLVFITELQPNNNLNKKKVSA